MMQKKYLPKKQFTERILVPSINNIMQKEV